MKNALDLPWMKIAHNYIGLRGETKIKMDPRVVKFFHECGDYDEDTSKHAPWCAAFVGACLAEAKLPNTKSTMALSYASYGQKLKKPIVGAIGYMKRKGIKGSGHVFFVASFDKDYVYALGGNQGDKVCIARFRRSKIVGYRWPPYVSIPKG